MSPMTAPSGKSARSGYGEHEATIRLKQRVSFIFKILMRGRASISGTICARAFVQRRRFTKAAIGESGLRLKRKRASRDKGPSCWQLRQRTFTCLGLCRRHPPPASVPVREPLVPGNRRVGRPYCVL